MNRTCPMLPFVRLRPAIGGLLVLALLPAGTAGAGTEVRGELARRGWLGIQLTPNPGGHPSIAAVQPGGSAEKAMLAPGDVVVAIEGRDTATPGAIGAAMQPKRAGDDLTLRIERNGEARDVSVALVALPYESSETLDVLYDVVETPDARLRSVVTRPTGTQGPLPAVLFIQGLQCSPVDEPAGAPSTVLQLIHRITDAGYAVMRCEKPGSGDATGGPCSEIGFHEETAAFRAALDHLRSYRFVDPDQVFLLGHSMGGFEAPLLATDAPVKGVVVFGTGVIPWAEYLVENERRQARLDPATDLVALEAKTRRLSDFLHESFRKGLSPEAVAAANPALADVASEYFPDGVHSFGRHIEFFRELDAVNVAEAWSRVRAPVLAIYGELDYTTCYADHEYVAQIVNAARPGTARALQVPRTFHAFNRRETVQETLEAPWQGPLVEEVVDAILSFLTDSRNGRRAIGSAP